MIVGAKDTELGHAFCMVRQPRGSGGFEAVRKLGFEGVIGLTDRLCLRTRRAIVAEDANPRDLAAIQHLAGDPPNRPTDTLARLFDDLPLKLTY